MANAQHKMILKKKKIKCKQHIEIQFFEQRWVSECICGSDEFVRIFEIMETR